MALEFPRDFEKDTLFKMVPLLKTFPVVADVAYYRCIDEFLSGDALDAVIMGGTVAH